MATSIARIAVWVYSIRTDDVAMDEQQERAWIAQCARRLRQRWRTVDAASLEQLADELRRDAELRRLEPTAAAEQWLRRGIPTL